MEKIKLEDIDKLAARAENTLEKVRDAMLEPHPRKLPPTFSIQQIARLCNKEPEHMTRLLAHVNAPKPLPRVGKKRARYSLADARILVKQHADFFVEKPKDKRACVISCVNFKGGSTKTTTAFNLAQGLTLRGRKVLMIDLDPQASLTTLCGIIPPLEIAEDDTISPITWPAEDAPKDLAYAVRATYWDGLDLIPSTMMSYNAELALVAKMTSGQPWCLLLAEKLEPLREEYDAIIIDTPPALSWMTSIAIFASQGIVMPLPPETLDYAASTNFWVLVRDILERQQDIAQVTKEFDFLRVIISRSENTLPTKLVRDTIRSTYGQYMIGTEIPKSQLVGTASLKFGTVHDISEYAGNADAYKKLIEAYQKVIEDIDHDIVTSTWGITSKGNLQ
jgi:chromosome partitioning protein